MRFAGRELKPYLETVPSEHLGKGQEYFSVSYVDDEMLQPTLLSLVFVGKNLRTEDKDEYYFQDLSSYASSVRYETASEQEMATFHTGDIVHSVQHFDQALDELLRCAIRRSDRGTKPSEGHGNPG